MRLVRPSALVLVVLVLVAGSALTLYANWSSSEERLPVANMDGRGYTIRVIDDWTGRAVVAGRLEPHAVALVFAGRSEEWWVADDPDPRRSHGFSLQVVGDECILTSTGGLGDNGVDAVSAIWDGSVVSTDWGSVGHRPATIPTLVPMPDPCAGREPRPRGQIVNRTLVPVSVGHGIVVPACDEAIVLPGDLPDGGATEPHVLDDAVQVIIPSMDAQDERWPTEPRAVVITAHEITDSWDTFDAQDAEPCSGAPRVGAMPQ